LLPNNLGGGATMKNQELIEIAEQQAHDDGECEGIPFCPYCLDAWEEANQEALDYGNK